jgi:hypothetical protein
LHIVVDRLSQLEENPWQSYNMNGPVYRARMVVPRKASKETRAPCARKVHSIPRRHLARRGGRGRKGERIRTPGSILGTWPPSPPPPESRRGIHRTNAHTDSDTDSGTETSTVTSALFVSPLPPTCMMLPGLGCCIDNAHPGQPRVERAPVAGTPMMKRPRRLSHLSR